MMKRLPMLCGALAITFSLAAPGLALDSLTRHPLPPPKHQPPPKPAPQPARPPRAPYTLHQGWPLNRPPRPVIVRRPLQHERIHVHVYLPPLIFGGVVIDDRRYRDDRYYQDYRPYNYPRPYQRDRLTWADSETLYREDEWVEFTLDCNARGEKLWFEVRDGRVQIDWAEVVFENGQVQVVDFAERSIGPGVYPLLDFRDGRRVDHVRMVAAATSREVRLILMMEQ